MPRRLLVIEDDSAIRRGIVDALRFKGYAPVEAANGKDGLRMAEGCDCDLVLLDLVLPGPGGMDILRAVRQSRPTLPVIILTVYPEEQYAIRAVKSGAVGFLTKETAPERLIEILRKYL